MKFIIGFIAIACFFLQSVTSQYIINQKTDQISIDTLNKLGSGAYIYQVEYSLDGISQTMLQNIGNIVVNATNTFNLSYYNNECFNASKTISEQIGYYYGNNWSVYCSIDEHGDSYFNVFNNSLVGLVVISNNYYYFFNIYLSSVTSGFQNKLNSSMFQKYNRRGLRANPVAQTAVKPLSQNMQAAYLNQTLFAGYDMSSFQIKSMTNIVLNNANTFNLTINRTSGLCTQCYVVAQQIDLNIQNYYGVYWSTAVIQQYYGDPYYPYYNGQYLSLLINSNGWNFIVSMALSAY